MKRRIISFYIEKLNLRLDINCYIENEKLYFDIDDVYKLFDEQYPFNIALLSNYFQRKYRGSHRIKFFGSYCRNGNIYIERLSLLRYFPFLIKRYVNDKKILYKLLFFYNNLKKRRNYEIL